MWVEDNKKPPYDGVLQDIANYVLEASITSEIAFDTARLCLMDSLGCALLSLNFSECTKLLGPIVPGAFLTGGARVPGTSYELDPVQAAFNLGTMIRWLDFNDTWLAAEWGHPSDNLGAILSVADYISRMNLKNGKPSLTMREVLEATIKAYEIQGCIALENSFNRVGLDHVLLVKLASAAVAARFFGADKEMMLRVLSQVFVDGQSLRTYRHAPNTGSRKSWAAGDASARGVRLALVGMNGEMGYPSALSSPRWGFYDVLFKGKLFEFQRNYGSYVIENILFKLSYPAEFHAQTAVECAVQLHPIVKNRFDEIEKIKLTTQESAVRIISKQGPLYNAADRDHCLQYMVAVALLLGDLQAEHYENDTAAIPEIDRLREKMEVIEDPRFSADYLDPHKRSIANGIQLVFKDGSTSENIIIEYPIGHPRRRDEGIPVLYEKFKANLNTRYSQEKVSKLFNILQDGKQLNEMLVPDFMNLWENTL